VITNADARMRAVLDDLGTSVEDGDGKPLQLDPILISEEVGVEKPSPRIYAMACEAAGVTLEETLHVGDELEAYVCPSFEFLDCS
jgi:FMN phosphatase YigB (HAD superfamily)